MPSLGVFACISDGCGRVLCFKAHVREVRNWQPNSVIAEIGYFAHDALPRPLCPNAGLRFRAAAAGLRGVFSVLTTPGEAASCSGAPCDPLG
ncbi:NUDIX hydrolase [Arenibaculum pallidiluteum]|uniref:hypothetical protein n=1 Tax=Arenibaculum pallidiluteum TaxID=2812559 RepID=UPI001A968A49|nr:hypothetical protein [Arenibaculum pallidiluteum]